MRWPLLLLALATGSAAAAPREGRYEARLCVATRAGAVPACGPADVEVRRDGRLDVRVADIVYRVAPHDGRLGVTTLHGLMKIDEFDAPYAWAGEVLRFSDPAKDVRYELHLTPRR